MTSPQMEHALHLLEISHTRLIEELTQAMSDNPLLTREGREAPSDPAIQTGLGKNGRPLERPQADVCLVVTGNELAVVPSKNSRLNLRVDQNLLTRLTLDPSTNDLAQTKLRSAEWLISVIDQRMKTICRVAECIVDGQSDFFLSGGSEPTPLLAEDIALAVGMHPSTIWRAVTDKYLESSRGIHELKDFLTSDAPGVASTRS